MADLYDDLALYERGMIPQSPGGDAELRRFTADELEKLRALLETHHEAILDLDARVTGLGG